MSLEKVRQVRADRGFRILDLAIYGAVLLLTASLFLCVLLLRDNSPLTGIKIYIADEAVYEYDFTAGEVSRSSSRVSVAEEGGAIVVTVFAGGGYNTVEIDRSGTVRVTEADCGKRDCVYTPVLKDNGGIIYCSPHKLKIIPYEYDIDGGTIIM